MPWCASAVQIHVQIKQIGPDFSATSASLSDVGNLRPSEYKIHGHEIHRISLGIGLLKQLDQFLCFLFSYRLFHDPDSLFLGKPRTIIRSRRERIEFSKYAAHH